MHRHIFFAALAGGAALLLGGCARKEPRSATAEAAPAVRVQVATVQRVTLPVSVETSGTVRAVQRAALAAKVAGTITSLPVTLGQRVAAGDILLTIAAAELTARTAQARAQVTQLERELARERTLQASGAGTVDAVKTAEDRLAQAQAAWREAETMVGYTTVRAPFDGVVAAKHVEAGDFAAPGAPLLQFDGRNAFEIETGLPESLAAALAVGAALEIELAGETTRRTVKLAELASTTDAATRTTLAKLAVPAGASVRPGQFVRVFVPGGPAAVLLVPTTAVTTLGQMERVFVVGAGDRAVLRLVKTGAVHGERVEIVAGLEGGERVVNAPLATLRDGQPLTLAP